MLYACYEPDWESEFNQKQMIFLYENYINKSAYPDFDSWLYEMLRTGIFVVVS